MSAIEQNSEGTRVMKEAFFLHWQKVETLRVMLAKKLHDWYYNDRDMLLGMNLSLLPSQTPSSEIQQWGYIAMALKKAGFSDDSIRKMNIRVYNIVERVIDKIAQCYKLPATRELNGGETTDKNGKPVENKQNDLFQEILEGSDIARTAKQWHKLGKLFNTVLVQPFWVDKKVNGKDESYLKFIIHTPAWCGVNAEEWDHLTPKEFWYPTWKTVNGKEQQVLIFWSATENKIVDRISNTVINELNPDNANPYGVLPVAVLRFKDGIDFWGDGMWDLVDGNEEVCVQVTNLFNVSIFQTHGQPVFTNTGIKGTPTIGQDSPIVIENAGGNGQQPSKVEFLASNAQLKPVQDLIEWMLRTLQAIGGLSPAQFIETNIQSGVAKILDNADLNESRQDDEETLREFEYDLFQITRTVWNYHNPKNKIDAAAEFSIEFGESTVIKTVDEKIKEREAGLALGTASRVDFVMEDHPEMTREQAMEKVKENLQENKDAQDVFGLNSLALNEDLPKREQVLPGESDNNIQPPTTSNV